MSASAWSASATAASVSSLSVATRSETDLLIDTGDANLEALTLALADLGVEERDRVVQLFRSQRRARWRWCTGNLDHYVDLLSGIADWQYADVEGDSIPTTDEGLTFRVLSKARLISERRTLLSDPNRGEKAAQDLEDLRCLE